jgi:glycosyltransferase involved in cell wall biosynthesis
MRIAIVGPVHPYKGGIPLHTTELANRLQAAGHETRVVSWRSQYPGFLYPGEQRVPGAEPELVLETPVEAPLTWYNPFGWWRAGRKLRGSDLVVVTYFVPYFQGTSGLVLARALGRGSRRPGRAGRPSVAALCHNVLQHDPHPGDRLLTKLFLSRVDSVIVHTDAQAALARSFTAKPVRTVAMAPHLPASARVGAPAPASAGVGTGAGTGPGAGALDAGAPEAVAAGPAGLKRRLLFFGLVREYKGVDVLLRALAQVPDVALTIAGEARVGARIDALIDELGLRGRVEFSGQYVPAGTIPGLFAAADALVLPYRSGTATQNVDVGFAQGVPVIATRVGSMGDRIRPDVDGLLCRPDDVDSLADAIRHFYQPGVAERLRSGVPRDSADAAWDAYLAVVTQAADLT